MSPAARAGAPAATLTQAKIPGARLFRRGKVRDVYEAGDGLLVMVASDRLSAFDVVLPTPIPQKGRVLTRLSSFWFERTKAIAPNHIVETDLARFPEPFRSHPELGGRSVLVRRCERIDIECVARGYVSGSAWAEYRKMGTIVGERMPPGLLESEQLREPIFTTATKAVTGHDENISRAQLAAMVGHELAKKLEAVTIALYRSAHAFALGRGLILADTKFEFGFGPEPNPAPPPSKVSDPRYMASGPLTLIDEVLTPDSSRYWDAARYRAGETPPSFDKQYVRDFLVASGWNKEPPAPKLPPEVVEGTSQRYLDCYERIVGRPLDATDAPPVRTGGR
ncbi:MAG: phosphoribosylaminoimidazolesuccinocarboxamide synthase [Chloroflexi bacterium RIFCSPLOWO2_12_FULL_71_12]|nr:MAG: phosphoribosylaminoimidazolesuccinocarboxamide synthase [Chloroflexi bacterium RIFCSPLOWO2_12_FULL_71_12]